MADISIKAKDECFVLALLGKLSRFLTTLTAWAGALVLFINVLVVFASVIWRYALHSPIHWAEEVATPKNTSAIISARATSSAQ